MAKSTDTEPKNTEGWLYSYRADSLCGSSELSVSSVFMSRNGLKSVTLPTFGKNPCPWGGKAGCPMKPPVKTNVFEGKRTEKGPWTGGLCEHFTLCRGDDQGKPQREGHGLPASAKISTCQPWRGSTAVTEADGQIMYWTSRHLSGSPG